MTAIETCYMQSLQAPHKDTELQQWSGGENKVQY